MTTRILLLAILSVVLCVAISLSAAEKNKMNFFEGHTDIGPVGLAGGVDYDAAKGVYTVTGAGEDIWLPPDAFHYVWKKVSGDYAMSATIKFLQTNGHHYRKALIMVRQSLDPDAIYADIVLHADGSAALQFRDEKGGPTRQVWASVRDPKRLRLVRRGQYVHGMVAREGEQLKIAAGSPRIPLTGEYYIGIGVSSHDTKVLERIAFSEVELQDRNSAQSTPVMFSVLEAIKSDGERRAVYVTPDHIEAPNWTPDGKSLLFNSGGKMFRLAIGQDKPTVIETGFAIQCNNDHGISPDGKTLVISDQSQEGHKSIIYTLPITGGAPKHITKNSPSYWHGWSPDGKTLAFVGERGGQFDIYTIPVDGGEETRLTTANGLDDGPEYTPDGKYIYFNSERTGHMQIWRMKADGSDQEQVTFDEHNDWFPHFSPDGKQMAFLSYEKDVQGHPPNKDVMLRLMSVADGKVKALAKLFGGQGTMNVPSWSPDGSEFAFVSYVFVDPVDAH